MRNGLIIRKLITAITVLLLLLYFMSKTTSPIIIFVPFLFCSIASIGKNFGLLFNKKKLALFSDKLFKASFFLFWFGFLFVACYIMIRDNNCRMILYTVPFWLAGIFFVKRKLVNRKEKN